MIKKFGDNTITIRQLSPKDTNMAVKFKNFLNSLVKEDAMIYMNVKQTKQQEIEWLKGEIKKIKAKKEVCLIATSDGIVVANATVTLDSYRKSHIGDFAIGIRWGYRGFGLGTFLMERVLKLAKKELKPTPKIFRLGVLQGNKPASRLYTKLGFREVARIPKELEYKGKLIAEIIMTKQV